MNYCVVVQCCWGPSWDHFWVWWFWFWTKRGKLLFIFHRARHSCLKNWEVKNTTALNIDLEVELMRYKQCFLGFSGFWHFWIIKLVLQGVNKTPLCVSALSWVSPPSGTLKMPNLPFSAFQSQRSWAKLNKSNLYLNVKRIPDAQKLLISMWEPPPPVAWEHAHAKALEAEGGATRPCRRKPRDRGGAGVVCGCMCRRESKMSPRSSYR